MTARRVFATGLAVLCLFAAGSQLLAHPTAVSFVTVVAPGDGRVAVTVVIDGRGLLLKLAGDGVTDRDQARILDALRARSAGIIDRTSLQADAAPVPLRVLEIKPYLPREGAVEVHLTGLLPDGTTSLSWQSSLFASAYPISVGVVAPGAEARDDYEWIEAAARSRSYAYPLADESRRGVEFGKLVRIGFIHIVPDGLDHVLFMLGLFLLTTSVRTLLVQVSAFTVAHTATFALASLEIVRLPAALVEPLIALSIAWIGVENLFAVRLTRTRLVAVMGFGLLHGLGFAGALGDLGLSGDPLPVTLVAFNLGVELGQLTVLLAAAALLAPWRLEAATRRRWVSQPASVAIAVTGVFWAGERVLSM